MFTLLIIYLVIDNAVTVPNEKKIRRTDAWYPFILSILVWKKPYDLHVVCTASVIKSGWFVTAHFCLDIYDLGDSSLNKTPDWVKPDSNEEDGKIQPFVYEIDVTILHPDYAKVPLFTKINVKVNNCLALGNYNTSVFDAPPRGISDDGIIPFIADGSERKWFYGYFSRQFFIQDWLWGELIYDDIALRPCIFPSKNHHVKFPNTSICIQGRFKEFNEAEPRWFEFYGAVLMYRGLLTGVAYEPPFEKLVACCTIVQNLAWIRSIINKIGRSNDPSFDLNFSIDLTIDSK